MSCSNISFSCSCTVLDLEKYPPTQDGTHFTHTILTYSPIATEPSDFSVTPIDFSLTLNLRTTFCNNLLLLVQQSLFFYIKHSFFFPNHMYSLYISHYFWVAAVITIHYK